MTLTDLHRLCVTRGLGFGIDPKTRPRDSNYITVYHVATHAQSRKAFSTEAEMIAALDQCAREVGSSAPDDFSATVDSLAHEFG